VLTLLSVIFLATAHGHVKAGISALALTRNHLGIWVTITAFEAVHAFGWVAVGLVPGMRSHWALALHSVPVGDGSTLTLLGALVRISVSEHGRLLVPMVIGKALVSAIRMTFGVESGSEVVHVSGVAE